MDADGPHLDCAVQSETPISREGPWATGHWAEILEQVGMAWRNDAHLVSLAGA